MRRSVYRRQVCVNAGVGGNQRAPHLEFLAIHNPTNLFNCMSVFVQEALALRARRRSARARHLGSPKCSLAHLMRRMQFTLEARQLRAVPAQAPIVVSLRTAGMAAEVANETSIPVCAHRKELAGGGAVWAAHFQDAVIRMSVACSHDRWVKCILVPVCVPYAKR
jgi:hypothetical protein